MIHVKSALVNERSLWQAKKCHDVRHRGGMSQANRRLRSVSGDGPSPGRKARIGGVEGILVQGVWHTQNLTFRRDDIGGLQ